MPQVGIAGEGLYPHVGAGTQPSPQRGGRWAAVRKMEAPSGHDELLERLREAVFFPQPRDGSLCRHNVLSHLSCTVTGEQRST